MEPDNNGQDGKAVRAKFAIVLFDNGQLEVQGFPTNEMLALYMHEKAGQVIREWFKQQEQQQRVVVPNLIPPKLRGLR